MWPRGRPAVPLHSDPPGGLSQAHAHRCLPLSAPGLPGDGRGLRTPLQRVPLPCPAAGARTPRPALLFLRCCSFRPGPAEFPGTAALQEAVSGCLARGAGVGRPRRPSSGHPPAPHLFLERSAPSPGAGEAAAQGRAPRASRGGVPPIAVVQASATHEVAQRLCSPRWHSTLVLDRDVQVNATKRNAAHRAASRQDATRRRDANATP